MRQIGSIPHQSQAERFTAYLITEGISAQAEVEDDQWLIWVRDEDQLEPARQALEDFLQNPEDGRYRKAVRQANTRLQQDAERREKARRKQVTMSSRWQRHQSGPTPLVNAVIAVCIVVFFLTEFGDSRASTAYRTLAFCDPIHELNPDWNAADPADRAIDIRNGEIWRIITPAFMHGDLMHIAFNLFMFHMFAAQIERRRGPLRLALLILIIAAVSNAAQGLAPVDWGPFGGTHRFLGISGVVYGLLGYLWMKTVYEPNSGLFVSGGTVMFLTVFMLLGFTGALESIGLPSMANLAHGVGMLSGMVLGYLPVVLRPGTG